MPAERLDVTGGLLRDWPLPHPDGGKQARGQVLVVGGSRQTPGAVLLAAVAALRAGAGKLQIATVDSVAAVLATVVPEALVQGLPETPDGAVSGSAAGQVRELVEGARAVLVGPGMADAGHAGQIVRAVLDGAAASGEAPVVVVDALGLAHLGDHPDALRGLGGRAVLTPNPVELALMTGADPHEVDDDPQGRAVAAAERCSAVVALGAAESYVAVPDGRCWVDSSGGPGLGVSGSGDAFAGLVTGLAARGAEPVQAAVWAAHLHGRAGDRLAARVGRLGYLAREIVDEVPLVLTELEA
ncbi:MAG: NAD(P)H-hydrate dehydratase [Frankiaceae bacterium]